jgi:multiple sugar transport system permease protein
MENTAIPQNKPTKTYIDFKRVSVNDHIVLSLKEAGQTTDAIKKAEGVSRIIMTIFTYVFIVALAVIVIFPFYWMLITSLKQNDEILSTTQTFFPTIVMWSNYTHVFQVFDFTIYMRNTIVVAFFSTLGTLITTILAAFAFARLRFKGRDTVFAIFLMTMMIPGEMMVISNYITVASFGWIGEGQTLTQAYLAMIVPFFTSVFYIYLLRQNFKQIPNELYLAARVDGKSDWEFLWKVAVPLAAPTLISITILKFMGTWNSYVWPNLVTNKNDYRLISNGLRGSAFFDVDSNRTEYGYQMAATVLVTVPLFLLFVFFRKYIMRGVGRAGIKG